MSQDARWWAVEHVYLRSLLERARDGEDIDALLLETYANSDAEQVPGDDDGPERWYREALTEIAEGYPHSHDEGHGDAANCAVCFAADTIETRAALAHTDEGSPG